MSGKIFLVGMPGAGKTTIGRKLSAALELPFLDLDEYIEAQHGMNVREIFASKGEVYFRNAERKALEEVAQLETSTIVATGGGTPCFHENMALMNEAGTTIYLKVPANVLAERLANGRDERPLVAGKSTEEIKQFIFETLTHRSQFYEQAHITYQNPGRSVTELCQFINNLESTC